MHTNPTPSESDLAFLLKQGTDYADSAMRKLGHVPPALFALTPHGGLQFVPSSLESERAKNEFPNFKVVATTLRAAKTATLNDWGAVVYADGQLYRAPERPNLEIFDRVGGGDSFASGLIYGFLAGYGPQWAVECGAAHGALAMTTPGDTTMVTLAEVERVMKGGTARVSR